MMIRFLMIVCCFMFINTAQADELDVYKNVIRKAVVEHENTMRAGAVQDFNNMDKDKNDCATFNELNEYLSSNRTEENREMFEYIDADNNDCITRDEMIAFVDQTINTIKYD